MNTLDLNDVVDSKVSADGVLVITKGAVLCAQVRSHLRALLKAANRPAYDVYQATMYPTGMGSDTPATRLAATHHLFDASRDLLMAHYVSTREI